MAYYMMIKRKEYEGLSLEGLETFKRVSRYKDNRYSLEEIDRFTSQFEDETTLKTYLVQKGIIGDNDLNRELSIRCKNNGKYNKVYNDMIYKKDIKYLDCEYLRSKILVLGNDKEFLIKLVSRYRNSYTSNIEINIIRNYLEEYESNKEKIKIYLDKFIISNLFIKDKDTGEVEINYRNLHDLAAFVISYEKSKEPKEVVTESQEAVKTKVKRKKVPYIEGQMSFWGN